MSHLKGTSKKSSDPVRDHNQGFLFMLNLNLIMAIKINICRECYKFLAIYQFSINVTYIHVISIK